MTQRTLREVVDTGGLATGFELTGLGLAVAAAMSALHASGSLVGVLDPDHVVVESPLHIGLRPTFPTANSWAAPERREGREAGLPGDSYLWGACVAYAAARGRALSMSELTAAMPAPLSTLVIRSLSAAPAARPGFEEISSTLSGRPTPAVSPDPKRPRGRALVWALVAAAGAGILGILVVLLFVGRTPTPSSTPSIAPTSGGEVAAPSTSTPVPASSPAPTPSVSATKPVIIDTRPQPPAGTGIVAPSGTSFLEGSGSPVRCAYFPVGTAGQVIACIDDESDTLVRLNAGMIRVTRVTSDQSAQVPRIGAVLEPGGAAWLYGTRPNDRPLFECWGVPNGIACRELARDDWFVMTGGSLRTS